LRPTLLSVAARRIGAKHPFVFGKGARLAVQDPGSTSPNADHVRVGDAIEWLVLE
jgi:hypothetical protein